MNELQIYNEIKKDRNLEFINPTRDTLKLLRFNPARLTGIKNIASLIEIHKKFNSKILVFCDYDVDGLIGGFILHDYLKKNDYNVDIKVSDRQQGYGFSDKEVQEIIKENYDLCITVDLGINENKNIAFLHSKGVEVIVTDHHNNEGETPNCFYLNPKVNNEYFFKELSGAGVVWKLICEMENKPVYEYLDLVAIANIGDSVPLIDENRVITKVGLQKLNNTPFKPLETMLKYFKLKGRVTSSDIMFQINPSINAVNRLKHSDIPIQILQGKNVKENVKEMIKLNKQRKKDTEKAIESLDIDTNNNIIVVKGDFKRGQTGLIASKLMDRYKVPVVAVSSDLRGSSRSMKGLKITDLLKRNKQLFHNLGGHDYASGFTLKEGKFEELRTFLYTKTRGLKYKVKKADMVLENLDYVNEKLVDLLENLAPFGVGNSKPLFKLEGIKLNNYNETRNGKHLQFSINNTKGIWFSYNKDIDLNKKINIIFEVEKDYYRGEGIQLIIREVEKYE